MPDLTPTAAPTDDEFLDYLSLVDGGIFPAMQAIIDILRVQVPLKTAVLNTAKDWTGTRAIPVPKRFGIAPGRLTDDYIDSVVVGASVQTGAEGPGEFINTAQLVIYSVGKRIEIAAQVEDAHQRAAVIRGIMRHYLTGFVNSDGLYLWKQLEPTGVSFLPEPHVEFAGVALYYKLIQPPGENFWADL